MTSMTTTNEQSSREQEREVPRPAKAKGWSALDLHAAQCYEDAQRFAPRLPDPPTVSAPTAGQLQLSALWELQARVGDAHENHGRNDERTMKAREVFYEALRSALSTPPTAITAEEAGREGEAKDGARYRWLCEHMIIPRPSLWDKGVGFLCDLDDLPSSGRMAKSYLDSSIDAAMKLPPSPAQSGGQGNG